MGSVFMKCFQANFFMDGEVQDFLAGLRKDWGIGGRLNVSSFLCIILEVDLTKKILLGVKVQRCLSELEVSGCGRF